MDESFAAVTQNNWDNCCGFNENGRGLPGSISFNRLLKQYQRRRRAKTNILKAIPSPLCGGGGGGTEKAEHTMAEALKAIHIQKCRHCWASAHYWKYGGFNGLCLVIEYNSIQVHFSFTMAQIWIAAPSDRMRCTLLWRSLPALSALSSRSHAFPKCDFTLELAEIMRWSIQANQRAREIHAPVYFSSKCTAADRCKTQSKQSNISHPHCDTTDSTVGVSQLGHIAQWPLPNTSRWSCGRTNIFQTDSKTGCCQTELQMSHLFCCQSQWKVDWSCQGDPAGSVHSLTQHFNIKSVIVGTSRPLGPINYLDVLLALAVHAFHSQAFNSCVSIIVFPQNKSDIFLKFKK